MASAVLSHYEAIPSNECLVPLSMGMRDGYGGRKRYIRARSQDIEILGGELILRMYPNLGKVKTGLRSRLSFP